MKLEAVPSSVAQTYQGSVSKAASTAKTPKAVNLSSSTPKTVNIPNTADQSKMADVASARPTEEGGRIIKQEAGTSKGSEKTIIFDASDKQELPETTMMQQSNKQIEEAIQKLKEKMAENTEAVFGIHEGTNRVMIKIVDKETKDVLKEFPPEKTLDMIQKVWEMAGILVDEKL